VRENSCARNAIGPNAWAPAFATCAQVAADGGDPARALDLVAASRSIQVIDCELAGHDGSSRVSAAHFAQLLISLC
jgi:hypothetical protein